MAITSNVTHRSDTQPGGLLSIVMAHLPQEVHSMSLERPICQRPSCNTVFPRLDRHQFCTRHSACFDKAVGLQPCEACKAMCKDVYEDLDPSVVKAWATRAANFTSPTTRNKKARGALTTLADYAAKLEVLPHDGEDPLGVQHQDSQRSD